MIKIRKNVFETNSSSMHAITVPAHHGFSKEYIKNKLLKELERYKVSDNKYVIDIWCKDENVDKSSFTRRAYVCHNSLNDKLIYMLGTLLEHHTKRIEYPSFRYSYKYAKSIFKKTLYKFLNFFEFLHWRSIWFKPNKIECEKIKKRISDYEKWITERICDIIGDDYSVEVHLNYLINKKYYTINYNTLDGLDWFSLGCYGNEELYYKVFESSWTCCDWLINPYAMILAGSDEMSDREREFQRRKSKKLLKDSFKRWFKTLDNDEKEELKEDYGEDFDNYLEYGSIIYPVGG